MMQCLDFESALPEYVANDLSKIEQDRCDQHLAACSHCSDLLNIATGTCEPTPAVDFELLVGDVMKSTVGSPCERAETCLTFWIEEELPEFDTRLVNEHCQNCSNCSELQAVLQELKILLPTFREHSPGKSFVAKVMHATRVQRPKRLPWSQRLPAFMEALWNRPRIAWEVAYAGTVIVALLFGTPGSPLKSVPQQAYAVVQVDPRQIIARGAEQADHLKSLVDKNLTGLWSATGERALQEVAGLKDDYRTEHPRANTAWDDIHVHVKSLVRAVAAGDLGAASSITITLKDDFQALWNGIHKSKEDPDVTQ